MKLQHQIDARMFKKTMPLIYVLNASAQENTATIGDMYSINKYNFKILQ